MTQNIQNIGLTEIVARYYDDILESSNSAYMPSIIDIKKKSFNMLIKNGLPTLKNEEWKYTNVQFLNKIPFTFERISYITQKADNLIRSIINKLSQKNYLVFFNGKFLEEYSKIEHENIEIINFKLDSNSLNPLIISSFNKLDNTDSFFSLMNTIIVESGIFINVPKNNQIDKPINLINILSSEEKNIITSTRTIINISPNSMLDLIIYNYSDNKSSVLNTAVNDISLNEGAQLNLLLYQNEDKNTITFTKTNVNLEKESNLITDTITFSRGFTRNDLNVNLTGEFSKARFYGLYIGKDKSFIDNHTRVEHKVAKCQSDEFYKGIIDDSSHCVFNGKIIVSQEAQKTNAYQSNKNILLSENGIINTKPQLEIYADDVKCSHGATVGNIEKDAIFYLKSRGIDEFTAKNLLLKAFAIDIINKIHNQDWVGIIESDLVKLLNLKEIN